MISFSILPLVLHLAAVTPTPTPSAEPDSSDVARIDTYDGTLSIVRIAPPDRPWVTRVRVGQTLVLADSNARTLMLHTLTTWSRRRIALIEVVSGGNGCPSMYRLVEFAEGRPPRVSPEFGNCGDLPVVMMDGARLRVRFPGFYHTSQARQPGFRPPPGATWEYLGDGRVRQLPPPARPR